jgi:ribosomal protein S18 acetylase RimI-like enzyme
MLSSLQDCPRVYAFWIATPLTLGVEALPMEHRPVMHQVLLAAGFTGKDDWLYMKGLPLSHQPEGNKLAEIERRKEGWKVSFYEGHERIADAEIGLGEDHIGVLWWIEVQEHWRGQGLGKQLLLQIRKILGDAGTQTILLYVDHDDPTERNRLPAIRLYQSQSFVVIDHLWSYKKSMSTSDHDRPPFKTT